MLQKLIPVSNTFFDLTGLRHEPQISRSRDERVTAQLTFSSTNSYDGYVHKHIADYFSPVLKNAPASINIPESTINPPWLKGRLIYFTAK